MFEDVKMPKETRYKKFKEKNPKIAKIIKTSIRASQTALPIAGTAIGIAAGIRMDLSLADTGGIVTTGAITGGVVGNGIVHANTIRKHKNQKALARAIENLKKREAEVAQREKEFYRKCNNITSNLNKATQNRQNKFNEDISDDEETPTASFVSQDVIDNCDVDANGGQKSNIHEALAKANEEIKKREAELKKLISKSNLIEARQNRQNKSDENISDDEEEPVLTGGI